jgi:hypothetical protein
MRLPSEAESKQAVDYVGKARERKDGLDDILNSLLASKEYSALRTQQMNPNLKDLVEKVPAIRPFPQQPGKGPNSPFFEGR